MEHFLRSAKFALGFICLTLAWVVPDLVPPWNTFYRESFAVLSVIVLWPWSSLRIWSPRICRFSMVFVAIILAQGIIFELALGDILLGCLFALFACMAASMGAQAALRTMARMSNEAVYRLIERWCSILLLAALLNALIGLAQWQGVAKGFLVVETSGRVYGNLAQPNHFATLVVVAIGILIYFDRYSKLQGWLLYAIAGFLGFALVASESRTGALSFTLLVFCVAVAGRNSGARTSLRWLLPLWIIYWVAYVNWAFLASLASGSVTRASVGFSSSSRVELWLQSIEALKLRPWLGYGWLRVGEAQNAVAHYLGGAVNMDHTHLFFLDLLVWFGIPLGGLLGVACCVWTWDVVRSTLTINEKIDTSPSNDVFFYLLIMLPIWMHSMLEYPYAYTYFSLIFAFFAGAVEGGLGKARYLSRVGRSGFIILAVIGVFLAAWLALEYKNIEEDYRALRLEREFITNENMLHNFHSSPILLTQYGQLVATQRSDAKAPEESRLEHSAREVAMRFPLQRTHQHYYLTLLRYDKCNDAIRQRLVIASLFGANGIANADKDQKRFGINTTCLGKIDP